MAKVVWKTTPKAAYEWAEVEGGDTMKDYERKAMLDDFITENGLVPVETMYVGEVPDHRYGRYKADGAAASALPVALPTREEDVTKANAEVASLKVQVARLEAQLGKKPAGKRAKPVEAAAPTGPDGSVGGAQSTDAARAVLNMQDGVDIVPSGQEVREDMSSADRSDDNPKKSG